MATKKSEHLWMDQFKRFLSTLDPEEAMKGGKYEAAFKAGWDAAKNPVPPPAAKVEDVAKEIDKAAQDWLTSHEKSWGEKSSKPDPSMLEVSRRDAFDLRQIATLVRHGKFKEARNAGANLDTIVRDELPRSFFALLEYNNVQW